MAKKRKTKPLVGGLTKKLRKLKKIKPNPLMSKNAQRYLVWGAGIAAVGVGGYALYRMLRGGGGSQAGQAGQGQAPIYAMPTPTYSAPAPPMPRPMDGYQNGGGMPTGSGMLGVIGQDRYGPIIALPQESARRTQGGTHHYMQAQANAAQYAAQYAPPQHPYQQPASQQAPYEGGMDGGMGNESAMFGGEKF